MSRKRQPPPVEKCTFCGKSRHMVESLIAGPPHIYICNECVELCNSILIEELHKADPQASDAGELGRGADQPLSLDTLPTPREIHRLLDASGRDMGLVMARGRHRRARTHASQLT